MYHKFSNLSIYVSSAVILIGITADDKTTNIDIFGIYWQNWNFAEHFLFIFIWRSVCVELEGRFRFVKSLKSNLRSLTLLTWSLKNTTKNELAFSCLRCIPSEYWTTGPCSNKFMFCDQRKVSAMRRPVTNPMTNLSGCSHGCSRLCSHVVRGFISGNKKDLSVSPSEKVYATSISKKLCLSHGFQYLFTLLLLLFCLHSLPDNRYCGLFAERFHQSEQFPFRGSPYKDYTRQAISCDRPHPWPNKGDRTAVIKTEGRKTPSEPRTWWRSIDLSLKLQNPSKTILEGFWSAYYCRDSLGVRSFFSVCCFSCYCSQCDKYIYHSWLCYGHKWL